MASTTEKRASPSITSSSPIPAPIITTSQLIIRPYHPSDAPASSRNANDERIAQYMSNLFPHPYELHHAEFFINTMALVNTRSPTTNGQAGPGVTPVYLNYAIVRRSDGGFVGGIGLKPLADVEHRTWELGYWTGPDHWGQGLMSEAVPAFVRWAFDTFPEVLRIEAAVFEGNLGSQRVLVKSGFKVEGVRRKAVFKNGKRLDQHYFGMLREECPGPVLEEN